jgi:ABC-type antimicrobial peptide transport system permease subunit
MTDRITSFLQIYVSFGLAIGAVGMGVISVRNVVERKREIGMMRAIGFPRKQVMLSVLLELVVLGIIGLVIGVINGLLVSVGFANLQGNPVIIPWGQLGILPFLHRTHSHRSRLNSRVRGFKNSSSRSTEVCRMKETKK